MDKFYLIPVTSRNVLIGNNSLFEILKDKDSELYAREVERAKLTYEKGEISKKLVESGYMDGYKEYTASLYRKKSIPEKLIVKKNENGYFEAFTNVKLECDNESYFEAYSISISEVQKLVQTDFNYYNNVVNFVKKSKEKEKKFFKRKNSVKHSK